MEKVIVSIELTSAEAMALAQFVKRIGWSEMRQCAVDDKEAYEISDSIATLQKALNESGYAPR